MFGNTNTLFNQQNTNPNTSGMFPGTNMGNTNPTGMWGNTNTQTNQTNTSWGGTNTSNLNPNMGINKGGIFGGNTGMMGIYCI